MHKRRLLAAITVAMFGNVELARAAEAPRAPDAELIAQRARPDSGGSRADSDLGPSTEPPWNPPRPMGRRMVWERALLLPGRIATLPVSAVGQLANNGLLFVEQTALGPKVTFAVASLRERTGLSVGVPSLGDRTGLGITAELRSPSKLMSLVEAGLEHSATTQHYHKTRAFLRGFHGEVTYANEWRPQDRFYGIGLGATGDERTDYALHAEDLKLQLQWDWNRDEKLDNRPRTSFALWGGPRTAVIRTGHESGTPSFETLFPAIAAPILNRRVDHLVWGGMFSTDWRTGTPHWSQGWRFKFSGQRFDRPIELLALRVGDPQGAQFTRLETETETGFSYGRDPRTFRFLVRFLDHRGTPGRERFLLSDLATLGGREWLAGFNPGRFHDFDLALGRVAYVFPLVRRLEIELHQDWGGVYNNVWDDFRFKGLETSGGVALRSRLKDHPVGSIGVDFSRESTRIRFTLGAVD